MTDTVRAFVIRLVPALATALAAGAASNGTAGELILVDDPALGEFIDITETGEPVVLDDDGEAEIGTFQGNFVLLPGLVVVGMNGGAGFGQHTITDLEPENQEIPSKDAFMGDQAGLVYWDDIDDKEGDVYAMWTEDNRLIVQWNWPDFDGTGSTLKSQIQVFDNSEPTGIYAQFLFRITGPSAGAGSSATIGYQDGAAGFDDIQFSFNTEDAVVDGTVLTLLIPACDGAPCPADLDCDGTIGFSDLLVLLMAWGECGRCPADLDGNDEVGDSDLRILLSAWGPCPGA